MPSAAKKITNDVRNGFIGVRQCSQAANPRHSIVRPKSVSATSGSSRVTAPASVANCAAADSGRA